jgi:hypothetical protein
MAATGVRKALKMRAMYTQLFFQMKKQLGQLDKWLGTAAEHAKAKSFEPGVFAGLRLAPDQLPFARQIQICCDSAKLAGTYLTGKPADPQPDTEQTIEELQARVRSIVAYLDGITAKELEGAATRVVSQPRWKGEWMTGADYLVQHALPNFYFHLTTAYAILRHNGVALGKRDFLGAQDKRPPQS